MLKSEKTSNNEEEDEEEEEGKKTLLQLGFDKQLMREEEGGFRPGREEVLQALSCNCTLFEEQGLYYFSGYIVGKMLDSFHSGECVQCCQFAKKVSAKTEKIHEGEMFLFLKRYDDERSTLYSPTPEFVCFVRDTSLIVDYCLKHYFSSPAILKSITNCAAANVCTPPLCSSDVREKTVKHIVKTVFHYKVKWMNDEIRSLEESSKRKLKILKHK